MATQNKTQELSNSFIVMLESMKKICNFEYNFNIKEYLNHYTIDITFSDEKCYLFFKLFLSMCDNPSIEIVNIQKKFVYLIIL